MILGHLNRTELECYVFALLVVCKCVRLTHVVNCLYLEIKYMLFKKMIMMMMMMLMIIVRHFFLCQMTCPRAQLHIKCPTRLES